MRSRRCVDRTRTPNSRIRSAASSNRPRSTLAAVAASSPAHPVRSASLARLRRLRVHGHIPNRRTSQPDERNDRTHGRRLSHQAVDRRAVSSIRRDSRRHPITVYVLESPQGVSDQPRRMLPRPRRGSRDSRARFRRGQPGAPETSIPPIYDGSNDAGNSAARAAVIVAPSRSPGSPPKPRQFTIQASGAQRRQVGRSQPAGGLEQAEAIDETQSLAAQMPPRSRRPSPCSVGRLRRRPLRIRRPRVR